MVEWADLEGRAACLVTSGTVLLRDDSRELVPVRILVARRASVRRTGELANARRQIRLVTCDAGNGIVGARERKGPVVPLPESGGTKRGLVVALGACLLELPPVRVVMTRRAVSSRPPEPAYGARLERVAVLTGSARVRPAQCKGRVVRCGESRGAEGVFAMAGTACLRELPLVDILVAVHAPARRSDESPYALMLLVAYLARLLGVRATEGESVMLRLTDLRAHEVRLGVAVPASREALLELAGMHVLVAGIAPVLRASR